MRYQRLVLCLDATKIQTSILKNWTIHLDQIIHISEMILQ